MVYQGLIIHKNITLSILEIIKLIICFSLLYHPNEPIAFHSLEHNFQKFLSILRFGELVANSYECIVISFKYFCAIYSLVGLGENTHGDVFPTKTRSCKFI